MAFNRLLEQWKDFPTTLEQTLLKVIRMEIAKWCQQHERLYRWEQAEAYKVDGEELVQYAKDLVAELEEAERTSLIPLGFFEEGSPTEPDTMAEENRYITLETMVSWLC